MTITTPAGQVVTLTAPALAAINASTVPEIAVAEPSISTWVDSDGSNLTVHLLPMRPPIAMAGTEALA